MKTRQFPELMPHQAGFVQGVIGANLPARFLLVGIPGTGKSIAMAKALAEFAALRRKANRSLVIVPAPLMVHWKSYLDELIAEPATIMDGQLYRKLEAELALDANPWTAAQWWITSIDFLKSQTRFSEALELDWDVAVMDEADFFTDDSQRGLAAKSFWDADTVLLGLASSSFQGRPAWALKHRAVKIESWSHMTLAGIRGAHVFPKREVRIIPVRPSQEEKALGETLSEVLGSPDGHAATRPFSNDILFQRWESSIFALEQSLRRLRALAQGTAFLEAEGPDAWILDKDSDTVEQVVMSIDRDKIDSLLTQLEQIAVDTKWETCRSIIRGIWPSEHSVIVFTDFADTAYYLQQLCDSEGWSSLAVTGRLTMKQRWEAVAAAGATPHILIATSAELGGHLGFANQAIHYDLPWDPVRLANRFTRIETTANPNAVVRHHILVGEGGISGRNHQRVLEQASDLIGKT